MSLLERWTIEPSPTPRDPKQHILYLRAEKLGVYEVLREFGALCGRPQKTSKDDYNYSVALYAINPQDLQNIHKFLTSFSGVGPADKPPSILMHSESPALSLTEAPTPSPMVVPEPVSQPQPSETVVLQARESAVVPAPKQSTTVPANTVPANVEIKDDPLVQEPLFGATLIPDPGQTFDALIVGPFNRFAHAAGTAVVANPGSMYNPLILSGAPGVGKSHFLAAIGRSLQEKSGGKSVFFTSGCKLSWAVDLAVAQKKLGDLLSYAEKCSGLLIDDVHLMTLSERNQNGLKSILHHYLDSGKPVVMTSVYPPKALQFLEEALQFEIGSGYTVEIKLAGPEVRLQILRTVMIRLDFETVDEAAKDLQEALGQGFLDLNRWLRRMRALRMIHSARGSKPLVKEMLAPLLTKTGQPIFALDKENKAPQNPSEGTVGSKAIAVMVPSGQEDAAQKMPLLLKAAAQRLELQIPDKILLGQNYDPNQLYGVSAAIGEACRQSGASAVLIAGPKPGTQLAAHEGELYHALDHILAGLKLPLSLIPYSQLQDPSVYLQAVLDFYFGLWSPWQP